MQLLNTRGYGARNGVKILVYGQAGIGKTTLCATCPSPVVFSSESGLLALARFDLPYYEIKSMNDLREAFSWCRSSSEARNFQTICLDSISDIAETVLSHQKAANKDGRMAYGNMIDEMTKIVREFRDLQGFNVYMAAKMDRFKNETTGVVMNGPSMPGNKLGQAMPYFPDEVFKMDVEGSGTNSYRLLRTQPDFMNDAKDRSGALAAIEEPHLGKIINKITNYASSA